MENNVDFTLFALYNVRIKGRYYYRLMKKGDREMTLSAEDLKAIGALLDEKLEQQMRAVNDRLGKVEEQVADMNKRLAAVELESAGMDKRLARVERQIRNEAVPR